MNEIFLPDPPNADRWIPPQRFTKEADRLGGTDKGDWRSYNVPDTTHYSDKPDHLERSTYWQPNHSEHKQKD